MGINYTPPSSGGDMNGPGTLVTDNSLVRWDGTAGTLTQDSGVILDDSNNIDIPGRTRIGTDFTSPYKLSVQSNTAFTYIEILNDSGVDTGAFFGIENNGPANSDQWFALYNWQGGPIVFYTQTTPSAGLARFQIENDGTLSIPTGAGSTPNYESLVTADDDIPNKKFIDDNFVSLTATQSVAGEKTFTNDLTVDLGGVETFEVTTNGMGDGTINVYDQTGATGENLQLTQKTTESVIISQGTVRKIRYAALDHEMELVGNAATETFSVTNSDTENLLLVEGNGRVKVEFPNYETLVDTDDVVPNKKYLDDTHVKLSGDQTISGQITFAAESIIIDAPTATGNLELGRFTDVAPECFGLRQSNASGYFCFMPNATFPQLVLGSPSNTTGEAYVDVDNNRRLNLNVLDTGAGTPAEVRVGTGGLNVLADITVTGNVDGVDIGTPKNSIVVDSNQYQLENDTASPGNLKAYSTDRNGARGWFDQRTEHVYNIPAVSLYPPFTGFSGAAFTLAPLNAAWYEQDAAGLEEDSSNPWVWVRSFDSTNEEGTGVQVYVPSDAVRMSITITGRASVPPSGTDNVRFELARRKVADAAGNPVDGSWVAGTWDTYGLTDQNFKQFTTSATIASLSITAGGVYLLELVRTDAFVTDNLVDDFLVSHVRIEFS